MDNLVTGAESNILHLKESHRFEFIKYDVTNYLDVEGPIDLILHLSLIHI